MPTTPTHCLECNALLSSAETQGLCARCLLKLGLASQFGDTSVADAGVRKFIAPPMFPFDFGGYRVLRLLGRGGMGAVYEADQVATGRRVALKVLGHSIDSPEMRKRFLREGRLAASVNHPNSVYIYGTEEIEEAPVIAMELVAGGTLKDELKRRGPLPAREAVDAILQIIAGLEAAHAGGVLHRDVKPANCFMAHDGTAKVGDFGLSVSTLARHDSQLTASGVMLGTPSFAPPEQLRGDELDVRADIYSVGATLYSLLTGRAPFEGDNAVNVVAAVLDKAPKPIAEFRQDVPAGLAQIVARCLAKKRDERFADYAALRHALLPYSSAVPEPAPLGMRFLAGFVDEVLSSLPEVMVAGIVGIVSTPEHWLASRTVGSFMPFLCGMLIYVAYHAVPEGLWGAAVGKALCGLRVVGPDGAAPGLPRAFARTMVCTMALISSVLVTFFATTTTEYRQLVAADHQEKYGWIFFFVWWALFVTMRRSNGFAAIQDLVSGTRVVVRPKRTARPRLEAEPFPAPAANSERLGPYLTAGPVAGRTLLAAYDDVLRRHVWIRLLPVGAAPLSEGRRALDRATRLRWIGGVRSEAANWDAYETPGGRALLTLPPGSQPWGAMRHWLLDLTTEIDAATKDATLPATTSLQNVWLTADGRAVLLDEPWTTDQAPESFPVAEPAGLQRFLDAVAARAVDRSLLPLHARDFLHKLAAGAFDRASFIAGNLQSLLARPAAVSRGRRFASLAIAPAFLAILSLVCCVVIAQRTRRAEATERAQPELAALVRGVEMYSVLRNPGSQPIWVSRYLPKDPATLNALATLIAVRGHDVIASPTFAEQVGDYLAPAQIELARSALREHPDVSAAEQRQAEVIASPYFNAPQRAGAPSPQIIGLIVMAVGLLIVALVNLVCVLLFATSPGLRLFGLALVNRKGEPAGRLRLFWRSFVVWLPLFLMIALFLLEFTNDAKRTGMLLNIGALVFGWILCFTHAIYSPARGAADELALTRLVPR